MVALIRSALSSIPWLTVLKWAVIPLALFIAWVLMHHKPIPAPVIEAQPHYKADTTQAVQVPDSTKSFIQRFWELATNKAK